MRNCCLLGSIMFRQYEIPFIFNSHQHRSPTTSPELVKASVDDIFTEATLLYLLKISGGMQIKKPFDFLLSLILFLILLICCLFHNHTCTMTSVSKRRLLFVLNLLTFWEKMQNTNMKVEWKKKQAFINKADTSYQKLREQQRLSKTKKKIQTKN